MSCAARYRETTSLEFILNLFKFFFTANSRRTRTVKTPIRTMSDATSPGTASPLCNFQTGPPTSQRFPTLRHAPRVFAGRRNIYRRRVTTLGERNVFCSMLSLRTNIFSFLRVVCTRVGGLPRTRTSTPPAVRYSLSRVVALCRCAGRRERETRVTPMRIRT